MSLTDAVTDLSLFGVEAPWPGGRTRPVHYTSRLLSSAMLQPAMGSITVSAEAMSQFAHCIFHPLHEYAVGFGGGVAVHSRPEKRSAYPLCTHCPLARVPKELKLAASTSSPGTSGSHPKAARLRGSRLRLELDLSIHSCSPRQDECGPLSGQPSIFLPRRCSTPCDHSPPLPSSRKVSTTQLLFPLHKFSSLS